MRAVVMTGPGGPEVMRVAQVPDPVPGPEELLVRVRASALNRADLLQRAGEFTVPATVCQTMGVEVAGEVVALGERAQGFSLGQRVYGLVDGGGYAELCVMDAGMAIPMPDAWSFVTAAAVPEAFFTAHETLFELGGLREGQTVLIHAGASGMGTVCIQLARRAGARVLFIAGTEEKIRRCLELGGHAGILRGAGRFAEEVLRLTSGQGVDLVEDFIGGVSLAQNLSVLKPGGCLVQIGLLDGLRAEIDLELVVMNRLQLKGTAMRGRPLADKRAITARFRERWLPELLAGRVHPVIDQVFPLDRVADAHRRMEASAHVGKILLEP